jgi:hypothetical protein
MEKAFTVFVLVIVIGNLLADGPVRTLLNYIWLGFWILFFIFLIVHAWMDNKGKFLPKKRDKES